MALRTERKGPIEDLVKRKIYPYLLINLAFSVCLKYLNDAQITNRVSLSENSEKKIFVGN